MAGWHRGYKSGGRALLWCHSAGAGGVGQAALEAWGLDTGDQSGAGVTAMHTLQLAITAALGGPVMSGDQNGQSWGNSTAQTLLTDAWAWVKAQYGAKTDKVILAGVSMGGALALNWARANPTLVKAVILFYPAVSLGGVYNGTGGATQDQTDLNAAYGGSWTTNGGNSFDPSQNESSYTGVPIYMGYSDADTVVGTANQTSFITGVGGSALTSRVYHSAAHADMTQVNVNDLVTWITSYV